VYTLIVLINYLSLIKISIAMHKDINPFYPGGGSNPWSSVLEADAMATYIWVAARVRNRVDDPEDYEEHELKY
jgi:hypothetical protein